MKYPSAQVENRVGMDKPALIVLHSLKPYSLTPKLNHENRDTKPLKP